MKKKPINARAVALITLPDAANNVQHFTAHAHKTTTGNHSANIALLQANSASLSSEFLGNAKVITNWLPDSGASSHMTPNVNDLYDLEEIGYECCVHLADGHTVETEMKCKVDIEMHSNEGQPLTLTLGEGDYFP